MHIVKNERIEAFLVFHFKIPFPSIVETHLRPLLLSFRHFDGFLREVLLLGKLGDGRLLEVRKRFGARPFRQGHAQVDGSLEYGGFPVTLGRDGRAWGLR